VLAAAQASYPSPLLAAVTTAPRRWIPCSADSRFSTDFRLRPLERCSVSRADVDVALAAKVGAVMMQRNNLCSEASDKATRYV
jgi:hypothetical protein